MLLKKMLRDFKDHKIQFLSIFLMALIGVYGFTGISGEVAGLIDISSHYYDDTNLADGWVYGEDLDNDTFAEIEGIGEIKDAQREMVVDTVANYSTDPEITLHVLDGQQKVSKFYLYNGKDFDANDKDGIWIDKRFADARNLDVGDKITLKFDDNEVSKTIRGTMISPEYVYYIQEGSIVPNFKQIGYAYISSKGADFDLKYNRIALDSYEEIDENIYSKYSLRSWLRTMLDE